MEIKEVLKKYRAMPQAKSNAGYLNAGKTKCLLLSSVQYVGVLLVVISCTLRAGACYGQQAVTLELVLTTALDKSPSIVLQKQRVEMARAQSVLAAAPFDYQLTGSTNLGQNNRNVLPLPIPVDFDRVLRDTFGVNTVQTTAGDFSLGLMRQYRNGTYIRANFQTSRIINDLPFPSPFEQFTSQNFNALSLQAGIPLLYNRGGKIWQAREEVSRLEIDAQNAQTRFTIQWQIYRALTAYWAYLAAWNNLTIYQEALQRATDMYENSALLVEAEKLPRSSLLQIEADIADKRTNTLLAQQAYEQARLQLGQEMGIETAEALQLGAPESAFPTAEQLGEISRLSAEQFAEYLEKRGDLAAQKELLSAQRVQVKAAQQSLQPRLDLNMFVQRAGMQYGDGIDRYINAYTAFEGRNTDYGVGISFQMPLQNNAAKAMLTTSELQLKETQIRYQDNLRQVTYSIAQSISQLKMGKEAAEQTKLARDKAAAVLENETIKFKEGFSTTLTLMLYQDRLMAAELMYLNASERLAHALALLRFETGTFFGQNELDYRVFYQIPTQN